MVTEKLAQVHRAMKDRMGKDLFMYSITLYPEQDDPAALKKFATMHGALLPGWTFLTGDPYDIETIRYRLFRENHIKFDLDPGFHTCEDSHHQRRDQLLDPCQPVFRAWKRSCNTSPGPTHPSRPRR